ncbi:hypothetical protein BI347_21970 [Chromobacterium sphagni]|uniref:Uncharacterized protein n=1 Tax=Chromobacterium sphagni TaxID=1903179 RepID=A0A1S1WTD8_9NEIS|nr:hypothetical protein BI347_21970 [Chromobacterium sphagni]OHX20032.1 hypothetical protein BI344_15385 [Chromobacterium sphagni]
MSVGQRAAGQTGEPGLFEPGVQVGLAVGLVVFDVAVVRVGQQCLLTKPRLSSLASCQPCWLQGSATVAFCCEMPSRMRFIAELEPSLAGMLTMSARPDCCSRKLMLS